MSLKWKDIERIEKSPPRSGIRGLMTRPYVVRPVLLLVRFLSVIPWVRKRMENSPGGLTGTILGLWKKRDYETAAGKAAFALRKFRPEKGDFNHDVWWGFMRMAAQSLEQTDNEAMKAEVISMAQDGIPPFEGFDAARSFALFSRWRYREGDFDDAMKFALVASLADGTWPEPDFLLGWYTLLRGVGDPMEHFVSAIKKDSRIVSRILEDPVCRDHPDIIDRVTLMVAEQIYERSR